MPRCSVIIPWADRDELALTLSRNDTIFSRHDVETIVVNAGGRTSRLASLVAVAGAASVRCVDLPGATFNRSLCMNIGAHVSRAECLFLLDADILVTVDFMEEALQHLGRGTSYVTMRWIREFVPGLGEDSTDWGFVAEALRIKEQVTHDGRKAILYSRTAYDARPGHGLVMLRRDDMVRAGGLNSGLTGWGFEDTDFQLRLQWGAGLTCVECGDVTHLTHGAGGRDYAAWQRNSATAYANYRRNDFAGSLLLDAEAWRDRMAELSPGPTAQSSVG